MSGIDYIFVKMITFKNLPATDLQHAIDIELASYPADEAASLQSLTYRQKNAGNAFIGAYSQSNLVGFICGTCTNASNLEEETMSKHEDTGTSLCIHSVVVAQSHRKQGIATRMLRHYCITVPLHFPNVNQFRLISKAHLIHFYQHAGGFEFVQLWPFHHGKDHWFEMQRSFTQLKQYQVDAFVTPNKNFSGNPAAVTILPVGMTVPDDEWHKNVAASNALSETAFLQLRTRQEIDSEAKGKEQEQEQKGVVAYNLRWFTPTTEVDLCGHATLAAAAALWETGTAHRDYTGIANKDGDAVTSLHFHTKKSGVLIATRNKNKSITLNFPSDPPIQCQDDDAKKLTASIQAAFGMEEYQGKMIVCKGKFDLLIHVDSVGFLSIQPNMNLISKINARGVVVTTEAGFKMKDVDFISRWFGPQSGVPEDPVTGSAHCMLCCYWQEKLGKKAMKAYQASSRSGMLTVELSEDGERVSLTGCASIFSSGELVKCL